MWSYRGQSHSGVDDVVPRSCSIQAANEVEFGIRDGDQMPSIAINGESLESPSSLVIKRSASDLFEEGVHDRLAYQISHCN